MTLRGSWAIGVLVALAVSLAINFTLGGFVTARMFGPHPPRGGFHSLMGDRHYPPQMREAIRRELFDDPQVKERLHALRQARKDMFAAMRADPYDPAALKTALDEIQANTTALQHAGHAALERIVAETPADVRAEIGWRRRSDDHHRGGPPRDEPPSQSPE
ncbi:periplasmic heavy metal sensor [Amorphus sp. 3PC139-8]|uniref:periplasmic heavy metal sensor n=1 Tax=Amorphus sp. 3PC139-8 TaxID=2735676 RepID=UPI00345C7548